MLKHRWFQGSDRGTIGTSPPAAIGRSTALIRLIRPRQWLKNALVFAALLFSGRLADPASTWLAVQAFIGFCLASSAVYCLNDALDVNEDRKHPKKRLRPVAAGVISPSQALVIAVALGGLAVIVGFGLHVEVGLIIVLYLGINVLYCLTLKHAVLLDVMAIAAGFVLRAIGGAVAIQVQISLWFLVCIPLLSLLLAVAKRRHELVTVDEATEHRGVLNDYPHQLLDQLIAVLSASVIMAYLLYAMDSARPYLFMLTSPLIMYGVFRYLYLVYHRVEGGSPEELLFADVPLLVTVACWVVAIAVIIYLA